MAQTKLNKAQLPTDITAASLSSATTTITLSSATAPTTGQVLTAINSTSASWQAPSSGGSSFWTAIVKMTDQSTTASTLGVINDLTFTVISGKTYQIRGKLIYTAGTGGMFIGNNNSLSNIFGLNYGRIILSSPVGSVNNSTGIGTATMIASANKSLIEINIYFVASNNGTFNIVFGSQTTGNTSTIYANSIIEYHEF